MPVTRPRLSRVAVPLVTVPVLLAALAACGGDDQDAAPTSGSATASATALASASASTSAATSGTPTDTDDFVALIRHSLDEATTAQIGLELVTSGGTLTGKGQVDYTGDDPALSMKLTASTIGNADLRVVDKTLYVSVGSTGTFFKSDLTSGAASQLGGLTSFDPAASLEALSTSITSVTLVGSEELDGDPVEHYRFQADGADLSTGSASASAKPVTVDVWFDSDDLLRKTATSTDAATKVTVTLDDWGSDVDIEAPPASKVTDMPSGGLGQ